MYWDVSDKTHPENVWPWLTSGFGFKAQMADGAGHNLE